MNQRVSEAFGQYFQRLPLRSTPHIVRENAVRMDWRTVLPPEQCSYVLGNPPYAGKKEQNAEQKVDMELIWGDTRGSGVLDYVTCWYVKAARYIDGTRIPVAFVSTNSITQGEQVGLLWTELFGRWHLKIHFAHRTFAWISEARGMAHVHVVIIRFGPFDGPRKRIYDYDAGEEHVSVVEARNISPYLIEGSDQALQNRESPISDVPEAQFGSMPNDDGNLLLSDEEKRDLLRSEP